ncbi:MAG: LuxR C-terminal-related transcriptional regulator [Thermoanaerobaculia bacterium]
MTIDPLEVVSSTADAAFGTDEEGRIVIWNRAAERLLGYEAADVLGRPCHEILCGKDLFGNRFCDEHCILTQMARRHEAIRRFEMDVRGSPGEPVRVGISIIVIPGPRSSQFTMIHLLQRLEAEDRIDRHTIETLLEITRASTSEHPPEEKTYNLSTRELEVLRLVADGASSQAIADTLFISVATVRNHVQNVLHKLDVHSKLEAVSIALRHRLI